MDKKIVVLGGGTGLSTLLKGLKLFPLDITAVVSVSDNGGSTGILRKQFDIPAIGDIRRVLVSLSETEPLMEELLEYRFKTTGDLNNHPTGNLLLTALIKITGNISEALKVLGKVLNIKGKILPLSEDKVTLMVHTEDGRILEGERVIEKTTCQVEEIYYKEKVIVTEEVIDEILNCDYVVISMGSLYASIIPNLIIPEVAKALKETKAKKIFISNLMTECGTTNGLKVSDFIKVFDKYIGAEFLDVVIANNGNIDKNIIERYKHMEKSVPIILDKENLKKYKFKLIEDDFVEILEEKDIFNLKRVDKMVRHNTMKLALCIFSYIMNEGD
ncbi:MAG: gluconeogenesis factor YvcK family protein [Bacilli bacterium]